MLTAGALRACWPLGLAFIRPGPAGLVLVIAVQLGLVTCVGVFNPVFATYRLDQTATDRVARTLSAWSVTSNATIAALTALWGLLASVSGPRAAIAIAGLLILTTPLLLLRRDHTPRHEPELARSTWRRQGCGGRTGTAEGEVVDAYESGIGRQVVVAVRIEGSDQTLTVTFRADDVEQAERA
jgi:hypothetical protein